MIDSKEFFIDLVNAIPSGTEWLFQSSYASFFEAIKGIPVVNESSVFKIDFQDLYRKQLSDLANDNLFECINDFEVRETGKKILEAYDGFVIVTLSRDFKIERTRLSKYLNNDLLFISDEW